MSPRPDRGAPREGSSPIRRLIIIGDPDPSPARLVAVHNVQLRHPGQKIVPLTQADLRTMGSGERLYISAHGSPTTVGGLNAAALAGELLARGLRTGTSIDLKSCSTAVPGASFVENLEAEIRSQSSGTVIVLVEGYTSTHVITEEGTSLAKDPNLNRGEKQDQYRSIIKNHSAEYSAATKYLREASTRGEPIDDIARTIAAMTRSMFQELYRHNQTVAKNDEDARGTSDPNALRQHLDEFVAASLRSMDPLWGDELVLKLIREREHQRWKDKPASYIA